MEGESGLSPARKTYPARHIKPDRAWLAACLAKATMGKKGGYCCFAFCIRCCYVTIISNEFPLLLLAVLNKIEPVVAP